MAESIQGLSALERRLAAARKAPTGMMKLAGATTIGLLRRNIPGRRTSNTSRSIQLRGVTESTAEIFASPVLVYLDEGTGLYGPLHHKITPKAAKALHWIGGGPGKVRLSGRSRTVRGVAQGSNVFAMSTKGMKGRPFIQRSVQEASQQIGTELIGEVVKDWNGAA